MTDIVVKDGSGEVYTFDPADEETAEDICKTLADESHFLLREGNKKIFHGTKLVPAGTYTIHARGISKRRAEYTLVGDPTLKKFRELHPLDFDFQSMAVSLERISLPEYSEKDMPAFIAPEGWLDGILDSTIANADSEDTHHPKVVPTALTRISRGGKSRSLQELALAIKGSKDAAKSAYRIIKISFNTDTPIDDWENKNPMQALCVRIAFAARKDTSSVFQSFKLFVNVAQESVEHWLEKAEGTKCILMIDELNRLDQDKSVAEFLKNNFLIPAGRGLVFTSHVVTLNDTLCDYMDSASNREITSVKLPDVVSLADTRSKLGANSNGEGVSSSTLSPQHIVYLGKIPALIHTYLSPVGKMPHKRRKKVVKSWLVSSEYNVHAVGQLLSSMISGDIEEVPECLLEFMDIDKDGDSNYVRWVPYHMQYIIGAMAKTSVLSPDRSACLKEIGSLFLTFKDSKVQSGDSWEALFLIALLVRCLTRNFDDTILPLAGVPDEAEIRYNKPYSGDHFYSENPSEFIDGIPVPGRSSISLYWPGHAKFENYDIVVAVWDAAGGRCLYGYQCKEGSNLPEAFANEGLFDHSYVIRGAAVAKGRSVRRWSVPSEAKLQEFFGVSSTHWSPQAWKALKG